MDDGDKEVVGRMNFPCQHLFAKPSAALLWKELCKCGTRREPHPVICPASIRQEAVGECRQVEN